MIHLHNSKPLAWAIAILFCIVWFATLAQRSLIPTEGRHAEMAREMAASGDWVTPRLNGVKHFGKPPLQTWMNALTFKLFGLGQWQARLWNGVCGFFAMLLVAYTGRRVFNQRVGFIAALVLTSSFLWSGMGHFNSPDMSSAGMLTLALCSLLLAQRNQVTPREQRNWMLACWAGMALAVLSGGLAGILLPVAVVALYSLLRRSWGLWQRLHIKSGVLLFTAIAAPWFILVSLRNPEFPHFFFVQRPLHQFASASHQPAGLLFYFIPVVLAGSLPWLAILWQSLWRARREPAKGFKARWLLLIWCGVTFIYCSLAGNRLPFSILPVFPALALLIACYLQNARTRMMFWSAIFTAAIAAIGLAIASRIPDWPKDPFEVQLYRAYASWVMAAACVGLAGGLIATLVARLRLKEWSIVSLAATGLLSAQVLMLGHEPIGAYAAGTIHLPKLRAELTEQTPIYTVGRFDLSLPFYLQRTFIPVEYADDLAFGLRQQPELGVASIDTFIERWGASRAAGNKALAIVSIRHFDLLQRRGLPMRIVARDPRRVIVANLE